MGRREQRERERKRAVSSCQKLDSFILPRAKPLAEEGQIESRCSRASSVTVAASPASSIATLLESETGDSTCYEAKQEVNGDKQDELQRDEKAERV